MNPKEGTLNIVAGNLSRDDIRTYTIKVARAIGVKNRGHKITGYNGAVRYAYDTGKRFTKKPKPFTEANILFLRSGSTTSFARYRNSSVNFSEYICNHPNIDYQKHEIIHELTHLWVDQKYGRDKTKPHGTEFRKAERAFHKKFGYTVHYKNDAEAYIDRLMLLDGTVVWQRGDAKNRFTIPKPAKRPDGLGSAIIKALTKAYEGITDKPSLKAIRFIDAVCRYEKINPYEKHPRWRCSLWFEFLDETGDVNKFPSVQIRIQDRTAEKLKDELDDNCLFLDDDTPRNVYDRENNNWIVDEYNYILESVVDSAPRPPQEARQGAPSTHNKEGGEA